MADALALLLGLNPRGRALAVFLTVAGLVTLNWFSSATMMLIGRQPFAEPIQLIIGLLGLPAVFLLFMWASRRTWLNMRRGKVDAVTATERPASSAGLIVFLPVFNTFAPKLPAALKTELWKARDLIEALSDPQPDWPRILDYVQASNMQTPLEAVSFHLAAGKLHDVWVLATTDLTDAKGEVIRAGSVGLAEAFERVLREGMGWGVAVHDWRQHPSLIVPPYNAQATFAVVDRIFREEAPRVSLRADEIVGDITSGTVTMTDGMMLACALFGRRLQYTAAENDPTDGRPLEQPKPYAITVDETALRRLVLRHMAEAEGDTVMG